MTMYDWKRFWCPPTGKWHQDDDGFLSDPEQDFSQYIQPDVVSFESISNIPCLILLGEPGIGKTTAMHAEFKSLSAGTLPHGDKTDWHDLGSFSNEDILVREVFESPKFEDWKQGNHRLHLFLDSLDESRLEIRTIDRVLIRELQHAPINRLTMRIACRTAEWPSAAQIDLTELFGQENIGVYELLPLRRIDVEAAAEAEGIKAEEFMALILQKDIVPLSIKPVTLSFLLRVYKGDPKATFSTTELYSKGCRLLCEESNEHRRAAEHWGRLSADQRIAVAARIAAVTVLCNKYAMFTDIDRGDKPDEDLTIPELCGGTEKMDGGEISVTEDSIRETLRTGLFTSRGQNRMGWAHQTYAEFLAEMWLSLWKVPLPRIKRIMLSKGNGEQKLIPQLYGIAAWLGSMHDGWRKHLIESQPEVLLLGDLSAVIPRDKSKLVERLLSQKSQDGASFYKDYYRRHFAKLWHPGLPDQLRPFIMEASKPDVLRGTAIEIAISCRLGGLSNVLADIAIDGSQSAYVRQLASFAVAKIGDDDSRIKLKSLLQSTVEDDPDDELKGCTLRALWPNLLTIEEVLSAITPRRRDNLIGAYRMFLEHEFQRGLNAENLPAALQWVNRVTIDSASRNDAVDAVSVAIIVKAIKHIKSPEVFRAFGRAVLTWRKLRYSLVSDGRRKELRELFSQEDNLRRRVVEAIVSAINDPKSEFAYLDDFHLQLIQSKDIPWMIDRNKQAKSDKIRTMWSRLVWQVYNWNEPQYFDAILTACRKDENRILAETFAAEIAPVKLGSPVAIEMKARYERIIGVKNEDDRPPSLKPSPEERIANCLQQFEDADLSAWIRLTWEMVLEPYSTHYLKIEEPFLTETPGWRDAPAVTKSRIIKAAVKYAKEGDPETEKWFGSNRIDSSALAGYKALLLLKQEAEELYGGLPTDVWQKWASIILSFLYGFDHDLIAKAYNHAPSEVIDIVKRIIKKEDAEHGHIYIVDRIVHCWDSRVADALLSVAKDPELKVGSLTTLLDHLIKHDAGRSYVEELVANRNSGENGARARAVAGARALLLHAKDAGWSVWWPIVEEDPEFLNQLLLEAVSHSELSGELSLSRFDEERLGDLYILLTGKYPYGTDPMLEGTFAVTSELEIRRLRDRLLGHLKARGTAKACTAIRRIIAELPDLQWLKQELSAAEEIARGSTWNPIHPAELLALAQEFKPTETLTEKPPSPRFQRLGDYWEVWFEGVKKMKKDMVGMSYIAYLLQRPNEEIKVTWLYMTVTGLPPTEPGDPHKRMTAEQLDKEGLSGKGFEGTDFEVDSLTVDACKKRIQELEFKIVQAEHNGKAAKVKALTSELDEIRAYLGTVTDIKGQPRSTRDADKRIQQAVSKSISRAIDGITKKHESLGRHLKNSIRSIRPGKYISYKPERPIPWQL